MKVRVSVKSMERCRAGAGLALAGLVVSARATMAQWRYARSQYFLEFRSAIDTALGHYHASVEAAARDGVTFTAAHDIVVGRPPIRIENRFDLHCDVTARVRTSSGLNQLHFSVTGPETLVRFLVARLTREQTYAAVYVSEGETYRRDSLKIRFAIVVFAHDDTRLARVTEKLRLARR